MKIPATIVTGFLGAGKTTLLRHLLSQAGGRRIALVINEFGALGLDADILKGCGAACRDEDVVELSNGCICCTVADEFLPTIERLLDRPEPPDHIVIETSGLALPQPLLQAFAWPGIAGRLTVDGVVTVVDGVAVAEGRVAADEAAIQAQRAADAALDHDRPVQELFEDQLACADLIVVSKADLLGRDEAEALAEGLRARARPGVRALLSEGGRLPIDVLLGIGAAAEGDLAARAAPHHGLEEEHDHDEFESLVADGGEVADVPLFARRLRGVIERHGLLRLKGFATVAGKPLRLAVQAAGPRVEVYYDRPWGADERRTRLVAIAEAGLDAAAVRADLAAATEPLALAAE